MDYLYDNNVLELHLTDCSEMNKSTIRPLRHLHELREVYRMTHDCYLASGYSEAHASKLLIHYPYFDHVPQTTVLLSIQRGKIVGSVSYTLDGPVGYTVEEDFKEECNAIRKEGRPVATVWRLVVAEASRTQRSIVTGLINEVVDHMKRDSIGTALFSVNPKHENVYKRMLNMQVVARKSATDGLSNAPAVLLRGDPEKVPHTRRMFDTDIFENPIHSLLSISNY